jgi:hypothetical protein
MPETPPVPKADIGQLYVLTPEDAIIHYEDTPDPDIDSTSTPDDPTSPDPSSPEQEPKRTVTLCPRYYL